MNKSRSLFVRGTSTNSSGDLGNLYPKPLGLVERKIDVIIGGHILGGDSTFGCIAYSRATIEKCLRSKDDLEITLKVRK